MAQAILFDVDGTLLDSVDQHAEAWRRALCEFGLDVPFDQIRGQIGKGGDLILAHFLDAEQNARFGKTLSEYRTQMFLRDFAPGLKPPGSASFSKGSAATASGSG
jgi:beta-phosphoglucomutase-like phosphatase (HAD superfamily)